MHMQISATIKIIYIWYLSTFTPNEEGAPPVETQCTLEFSEMELITKDNVEIEAELGIFYRIEDPAKSEYRVDNIESFIKSTS